MNDYTLFVCYTTEDAQHGLTGHTSNINHFSNNKKIKMFLTIRVVKQKAFIAEQLYEIALYCAGVPNKVATMCKLVLF